jgi:hypothetical protein
MKIRRFFAGLLLVLLTASAAAQSKPVVVVELFTSEGCSSCPPADALFRELQAKGIPGVELVLLGEHVDYWNHLGWRDGFSSEQFTRRQEDYTKKLRIDSAYTPQAIVNGRTELVGNDEGALRSAIARATQVPPPVRVNVQFDVASQTAHVTTNGAEGELFAAVTEDGLSSAVKAGENDGRTLTHAAIVRRLIDAGAAKGSTGKDVKLPLDAKWNRAKLHIIAFVEDVNTGAILGAAQQSNVGGSK